MKTFKYSYPLFKLLKGLQIVFGVFSDYRTYLHGGIETD